MTKYEIRINAIPRLHDGFMQFYWQIVMICNDGVFTIKHGWDKNISDAALKAAKEAASIKVNW
jgi:hypothetical protein